LERDAIRTEEVFEILLDVSAGNRHIWSEKNPPDTIFIDREPGLKVKPDVLADFTMIPFRDGIFDMVVFDPPHLVVSKPSAKWAHRDPAEAEFDYSGAWWGYFTSPMQMFKAIAMAQDEIYRVTTDDGFLYFKWNNAMAKTMTVIPKFSKTWVELIRTDRQTGSSVSDSTTFWVLFSKRTDIGSIVRTRSYSVRTGGEGLDKWLR
jgi:hypothetical protein